MYFSSFSCNPVYPSRFSAAAGTLHYLPPNKIQNYHAMQHSHHAQSRQFKSSSHAVIVRPPNAIEMITRYITEVVASFNPFHRVGRICRIFLASLPSDARQNMKITTNLLPRTSPVAGQLKLKFSTPSNSNSLRFLTDSFRYRGW